ncbi:MAG: AhpC/TSA family protein [Rikenellaceae bacterium]|nr:AhpC/TSA family protein [Rikenellaceae bacterium]
MPYEKEFPLLDSALVMDDTFNYQGLTMEGAFLARLKFAFFSDSQSNSRTSFIIEPGNIFIDIKNWEDAGNVSGTRINDDYNELIIVPGNMSKRIREPWEQKRVRGYENRTWTEDDEREYMREAVSNPEREDARKKELLFLEKYADSPGVIRSMLFVYLTHERLQERIQHVLDRMPENARDSLYSIQKVMIKRREEYRRNREPDTAQIFRPIEIIPEQVQVGKPYSDFTGMTLDGQEIKLSEILPGKKLILLDFWASWCGPCIREMPVIAGLHEKYKDEGLAVIGISSDANEANWKQAIEQYNMDWLQLISAEGEDRIGELYSIKTIPYTVIIDGDGTILARKLRGEELVAKIDELMAR